MTLWYVVRGDSTSWQRATAPGTPGSITMPLTNAAIQDSIDKIPASAIVTYIILTIAVPFSAGATLEVGQVGSLDAFMTTSENIPQVANQYAIPQSSQCGNLDAVVRASVGGAPAAGSGSITVQYVVPGIT
jgi:hypothetical protein